MDSDHRMEILITGVQGLVGSACKELFTTKGWEVIGIDNNGRAAFFNTERKSDSETINIDIRNQVDIEDLFQAHKFDAIIHAAAQPSHDYATDHVLEDFSVNAMGTVNLLECARQTCPEAPFVYVSTDKVYGENMSCALDELETRYNPMSLIKEMGFDEELGLDFAGDRSFFGCSKAAADMYAQQYAARFGMKVGIFRPGCITGRNHAGAEQHGFLAYLAKCIKEGKTYTIYGNGKTVRDQIHAGDLATAFEAFIESPRSGAVYNIGGGAERSVSVLEAIVLLEKELGQQTGRFEEKYKFGEERKGDRRWDVHSTAKFERDYPEWKMKYSLTDIIKDLTS